MIISSSSLHSFPSLCILYCYFHYLIVIIIIIIFESTIIVIMQVINRSPKYKNKYVHRRTSMALENLTSEEVRTVRAHMYVFYASYRLHSDKNSEKYEFQK